MKTRFDIGQPVYHLSCGVISADKVTGVHIRKEQGIKGEFISIAYNLEGCGSSTHYNEEHLHATFREAVNALIEASGHGGEYRVIKLHKK